MTIVKTRARGVLLGVAILAFAVSALATAPFAGAAPQYPDMRMLGPSSLRLLFRTPGDVPGIPKHHFLHFTTRAWNAGEGPFEVRQTPTALDTADIAQRIYEDPAGFRDEPIRSVAFNPNDSLFSIPDIARYEVWTERAYARAQARNFTRGQPLFAGSNVGYCLADVEQTDPNSAPVGTYTLCNRVAEGVSVGWNDVTDWSERYQSVDFGTTPLPDGDYVLRVIVDPDNVYFESDGKSDPARESVVANSAISYFRIAAGQLAGVG